MRLMSSTSWEGIFTTMRNLFHTFMFYILKFTYLYHSQGFFLIIIFFPNYPKYFLKSYSIIYFMICTKFIKVFVKISLVFPKVIVFMLSKILLKIYKGCSLGNASSPTAHSVGNVQKLKDVNWKENFIGFNLIYYIST